MTAIATPAVPPCPSLTVTVIVALPPFFGAGVIVSVRLAALPPNTIPLFGTSAVLDELPLKLRVSPSTSAIARLIVPLAPVLAHWPPAATATVGGSLTGVMVIVKLCGGLVSRPPLAVPPLSFSTTVMLALPLAFGAVVKLSVPLGAMLGPALNRLGL